MVRTVLRPPIAGQYGRIFVTGAIVERDPSVGTHLTVYRNQDRTIYVSPR